MEAVVERQTVGKVPPSMTRLTIVLMRCVALLHKRSDASERDEPTTHRGARFGMGSTLSRSSKRRSRRRTDD